MQSVIAVTKIVTVPAARVLITRVRCVTQRVFQQREKNGEGGRVYVVAFGTYFGHRIASILVSASPPVTAASYR